jgi:hypothetical protein
MKVALVAAMALAVGAGPANASVLDRSAIPSHRGDGQTLRLQDAHGDTWSYTDVSGYVPSARADADVLRAQVTHGLRGIGVRLVYDDLRRTGIQWYRVEVHTPGTTAWFIVEATRNHYAGTAYQDVEGEWVRVPGLTHSVDYAADVMRLRVTRAMVGDPPWVRVRMRYELGVGDGTFFTDNPMNSGPRAAFTARIPAPPAAPRRSTS